MDNPRNAESIEQFIQQILADQYNLPTTMEEVLPIPRGGVADSEDTSLRFDKMAYGLVFEVEGRGRKIFHIPKSLMEDRMSTMEDRMSTSEFQNRVSNFASREVPRVLGSVSDDN